MDHSRRIFASERSSQNHFEFTASQMPQVCQRVSPKSLKALASHLILQPAFRMNFPAASVNLSLIHI